MEINNLNILKVSFEEINKNKIDNNKSIHRLFPYIQKLLAEGLTYEDFIIILPGILKPEKPILTDIQIVFDKYLIDNRYYIVKTSNRYNTLNSMPLYKTLDDRSSIWYIKRGERRRDNELFKLW